jgi:signal transduction histidine kinase
MLEKTKILIVDDHPENIVALSKLIEADDIEIYSATSADKALELLVRVDFGLALLDVQMPTVSGFDLARLIRGVKKYRHLPIIFVTAHQQDQAVIFEGYETGAVDLLFKPLDPHMVRSKVRVFVQINQQQKLLERLKEEAESANFAKSRFLANMSHEIRTPLSAVMGFSELFLADNVTDEERSEYAEAIRRNGKLLLKLIDDILDLSKIEAQQIILDEAPCDLNDLLQDIHSTLSLKAQDKNISLNISTQSTFDKEYLVDTLRMKQVLINIIGNAIKFTEQGSVDVRASREAIDEDHDKVSFVVADTGIGMRPAEAKKLFKPFVQADATTTRKFGGTGLGLVISKEIAKAMGGDVQILETAPGQGTTFEVNFALKHKDRKRHETSKRAGDTSAFDFRDQEVLIVDDSADNRMILELFLNKTGVRLRHAENGEEALRMVKSSSPDAILMDVQMPTMDGNETTRRLRAMGFKKPIIALTAHIFDEEHKACRESGCDIVMTKPVNRQELITKMSDLLRHH